MTRGNLKYKFVSLIIILLTNLMPVVTTAQVDQGVLKAAYIERITRFVEWPEEYNSDTNSVIILGVINNKDYAIQIEKIFDAQKLKNKKVRVQNIENLEDISKCHICIIDKANAEELEKAVYEANKKGVLLFAQEKKGGKAGVHFNFYLENEKLKFEINKDSVESAGFKVSHLLMKSARVI